MTTPLELWQQKIDSGDITQDLQQIAVMQQLDNLYQKLIRPPKTSLLQQLMGQKKPIAGLYLWGKVGTGKSFLIDTFFSCIPFKEKKRIHFHAFMQSIHQSLKTLSGKKDPLKKLAAQLAKDIRLLCFDEFFVNDIADAMLLSGLLSALFAQGVTLVTNSNCRPIDLYRNGMLRERFLPAIELIKSHTQVIQILTKNDYRLRHMLSAGVYYTPLDDTALNNMEQSFKHFSKSPTHSNQPISILGREIETIKHTQHTIWFDFYAICGKPRSQNDYLELAKIYRTILVSSVPMIKERQEDLITTFIKLVDILYDEHIRLILSAETDIEHLYLAGPMSFEFRRTQSRLIEMQSKDYFDEQLEDHLV